MRNLGHIQFSTWNFERRSLLWEKEPSNKYDPHDLEDLKTFFDKSDVLILGLPWGNCNIS